MSFKDLQLNKPILRAIAEAGYDNPTLVQEKTIPSVLHKKDVIVSAQTGTGKTAAFALPILQLLFDKQDASKKGKKIKSLIISPTRELAIQIEENFKKYSTYTNLRTTVIFGGASIDPQKDILKKGIDILIATPGRLLDLHLIITRLCRLVREREFFIESIIYFKLLYIFYYKWLAHPITDW